MHESRGDNHNYFLKNLMALCTLFNDIAIALIRREIRLMLTKHYSGHNI